MILRWRNQEDGERQSVMRAVKLRMNTYITFYRFLLKYISRDEIEILGRGNGGIVEIRNAIAQYEEPSPLFGFLRYRRRNVLIKYVPEECSRLVQGEFSRQNELNHLVN